MRSSLPKLLHPVCGRPMIGWAVQAARSAGASKIVVVDAPGTPLASHLEPDVTVVIQAQALGTGDAVRAAENELSVGDTVIVLTGDAPLIRPETVSALAAAHEASPAEATVLTAVLADPAGYGRVVRDSFGNVLKVVETKHPGDATAEEMLISEVNAGVYAFTGATLVPALAELSNENAQGEYYLPDVLGILRTRGHTVGGHVLADPVEMSGVNDRLQLAQVVTEAQRRIQVAHMLAGATIVNPATTTIDAGVVLAEDVIIEPGTSLRGATRVGAGSTIGPHSTLIDARVGEGSTVLHAYVNDATIHNGVSVGPFAYLRPGTVLRDRSKAGTFVEIKNSDVGEGSKVPHLSYIGDADIGEEVNLGAATITANYDAKTKTKTRTTIGAKVKTSVDTTLVSPVTLGEGAFTAAGSVIGQDVPPGALAGSPGVARSAQRNVEGYSERTNPPKERP
jgi:bifunctional UDP-N-acetylglucosamine pyrophosphorylase/glucosamine-1-phosphate N-acetyltransferase